MFAPSSHYLCSELIPVLYEDISGVTRRLIANLEEISTQSALVLVESEMERGCSVAMSIKGHDLYGHVESCSHDEMLGWFVKVHLHRDSHWSGRRFLPEHFLALSIPDVPAIEEPAHVASRPKVSPL